MEMRKRNKPFFVDLDFQAQKEFILDASKLKVSLCTRRSGKSFGAGLYLMKEAYYTPQCSCLYLALTRDSAKKIMWKDVLKVIDRDLDLGCKFHENALTCTLPNGSIIYLLGADSQEDEKRKLLGQKYKIVIIDEASAFSIDLTELIYGTLKPSVADYRGTICMLGTPSNIRKGLYYELTRGQDPGLPGRWCLKGWSGHRWSAVDNPHMKAKWLAEIEDLRAANPLVDETPFFKQNYLGQWVVDDAALVYRYRPQFNDYKDLPKYDDRRGRWHYVIGADLGYNDPSAFVLCAYHDFDTTLFVMSAESIPKLDVTACADRIKFMQFRLRHDLRAEVDAIVIDGANKQAVEEMRRRHGLALTPTAKTAKMDFIEIMNADFIQGRIKLQVEKTGPLVEEYGGLIWDTRSAKREEHPGCANHCCDATLYAWRHCYSYLGEKPKDTPKVNTQEWFDKEAADMEQAALDRLEEQKAAALDDWSFE